MCVCVRACVCVPPRLSSTHLAAIDVPVTEAKGVKANGRGQLALESAKADPRVP